MLSLLAAAIHGFATPEHFSAWWGYGLFFLAATCAQAVYGLLLLTRGVAPERWTWEQVQRPIYVMGIIGNLAIMALWIVTRTYGIPSGPEAGVVEPVGVLDAVSKAVEGALVLVLAVLFWRSRGSA